MVIKNVNILRKKCLDIITMYKCKLEFEMKLLVLGMLPDNKAIAELSTFHKFY